MAQELSNICTVAARRVYPLVKSKGLAFGFDCFHGNAVIPDSLATAVLCAAYRLSCALIEVLDAGTLSLTADIYTSASGPFLQLVVESCGALWKDDRGFERVVRRLGLQCNSTAFLGKCQHQVANGICPTSGGAVEFRQHSVDRLTAQLQLYGALQPKDHVLPPLPNAGGALIWLVNVDPFLTQSWTRRFSRLGWHVSSMASCSEAISSIRRDEPLIHPKLVLFPLSKSDELEDVHALRLHLPESCRSICAVEVGAEALGRSTPHGIELRVLPLSPQHLVTITEALCQESETCSDAEEDELKWDVLVVDDLPMAQHWISSVLETMGHRPRSAGNGRQAIDACRSKAPDVVLMNIGMPDSDGISVTKTICELQQHGHLPPFNVIGHTVSWSSEIRETCIRSGMLDCIPSIAPTLSPEILKPYLRRACTIS
ncbi:MAG: response regulator [Rubrivivax sp.]|nr:MAG: response regulator [Rubrivivax sp.]